MENQAELADKLVRLACSVLYRKDSCKAVMKNKNPKRGKEIAVRLRAIRDELNYSRVHNTKPLSEARISQLYSEHYALMEEYRALWV